MEVRLAPSHFASSGTGAWTVFRAGSGVAFGRALLLRVACCRRSPLKQKRRQDHLLAHGFFALSSGESPRSSLVSNSVSPPLSSRPLQVFPRRFGLQLYCPHLFPRRMPPWPRQICAVEIPPILTNPSSSSSSFRPHPTPSQVYAVPLITPTSRCHEPGCDYHLFSTISNPK